MAMSRKDFTELADSLRQLKVDLHNASTDGCDNSVDLAFEAHTRRIAQLCKRHNPEFQFGKFYDMVLAVEVPKKGETL